MASAPSWPLDSVSIVCTTWTGSISPSARRVDGAVNDHVTQLLRQLGGDDYAAQAGLMTHRLLADDDPGRVVYRRHRLRMPPEWQRIARAGRQPHAADERQPGHQAGARFDSQATDAATYLEAVETLHCQMPHCNGRGAAGTRLVGRRLVDPLG